MKEVTVIRGKVTATTVFRTPGIILTAAVQGGKLQYLYHEDNKYVREDDRVIAENARLDPLVRYRIRGRTTLMAKDNTLIVNKDRNDVEKVSVDKYGTLPVMDANGSHYFWAREGRIWRDGQPAEVFIGDTVRGRTLFWVGTEFGFGFWRAGGLTTGFVFDSRTQSINDNVDIPALKGSMVDATCVFSSKLAWFFVSVKENGKTLNRCYVIAKTGQILGSSEAEQGDGTWLSGIRGKTAAGDFLLVPTDEGVVRIEVDGRNLSITRTFPDTEQFVDAASHLHADVNGLYTVGTHEIIRLQIRP